jgi:hypothetical protein
MLSETTLFALMIALAFSVVAVLAFVCWKLCVLTAATNERLLGFTEELLAINRTTSLGEFTRHQVQVNRAKAVKNGQAEQGRMVQAADETADAARESEEAWTGMPQSFSEV